MSKYKKVLGLWGRGTKAGKKTPKTKTKQTKQTKNPQKGTKALRDVHRQRLRQSPGQRRAPKACAEAEKRGPQTREVHGPCPITRRQEGSPQQGVRYPHIKCNGASSFPNTRPCVRHSCNPPNASPPERRSGFSRPPNGRETAPSASVGAAWHHSHTLGGEGVFPSNGSQASPAEPSP